MYVHRAHRRAANDGRTGDGTGGKVIKRGRQLGQAPGGRVVGEERGEEGRKNAEKRVRIIRLRQ